ncbi:MAG TPA: helix-turn-helix transcriptional regulator [Candidatus Obscuribacterales bacterium]
MNSDLSLPAKSDALVANLGVVIQRRRKTLRMSQDELASRAKLHRTYISEIERHARNLSIRILARIAAALQTTPAELMREAEILTGMEHDFG